MNTGLLGTKMGMTRWFEESGASIPVTVLKVPDNFIVQVKTLKKDAYSAVQLTINEKSKKHLSKARVGHLTANKVEGGKSLVEFLVEETSELKSGDKLSVSDVFAVGQSVDVTGRSKGKGFAGVIKRWNFQMQDATHGNSLSHRAPGSIGQCQTPGKVWKGKKMAGRMGGRRHTVQNLIIVEIDFENGLVMVRGAVPGATGSQVVISHSSKVKAS